MKKICLFADISTKVGTGHFWRSARIAEALAQQDGLSVLCAVPDNEKSRFAVGKFQNGAGGKGAAFVRFEFLNSGQVESPFLSAFAPPPDGIIVSIPHGQDVLVVDSHRVSKMQLQSLTGAAKSIVVIDNYNPRELGSLDAAFVDLVINPGISRDVIPYSGLKVLCPPDYHLCSPDFFAPLKRDKSSVLVSFGGTDTGQMGLRLLDLLATRHPDLSNRGLHFTAAITCDASTRTYSKAAVKEKFKQNFELVEQYKAVDFFRQAAFYIGAAGESVFEAQAAGTKFVGVGILNETQRRTETMLQSAGCFVQNLEGVLDGADVTQQMESFADGIAPLLRTKSGITLEPQNPAGFQNLIRELTRFIRGPS